MAFFLMSSIVLGLLDQLYLFWRVVSDRIARALARFGMLDFFTNLHLTESQVRYLGLIILFSVIDSLRCLWIESLQKNIQLMLELEKAPFLVMHFFHYSLMTVLMMLSVILLSILMILLSTLNVIRHLIRGKN